MGYPTDSEIKKAEYTSLVTRLQDDKQQLNNDGVMPNIRTIVLEVYS